MMIFQLTGAEKEAMAAVADYSDGSKHDWRKFAHTIAALVTRLLAENEKLNAEAVAEGNKHGAAVDVGRRLIAEKAALSSPKEAK